jgi:aminomethyltransferase
MKETLLKTVLCERHVGLKATMVDFGGWEMPVQYPGGIIQEHLATRKQAGLFDVSHMGRFIISGKDALPFLQHVLTNNAAALEVGESQYTMIPNANGGAIDDAYLYRFFADSYLLVVNASNREKDWRHMQASVAGFSDVGMQDRTFEMAMISLQGPASKDILSPVLSKGQLPEPMRNKLSVGSINDVDVLIARTGYTGEPLCFELFIDAEHVGSIWDLLLERGAAPIGLGARDTLRLEAGLPLYGHELGDHPENKDAEIPIYACPLARFAVSFSPLKSEFIGKAALQRQYDAWRRITEGLTEDIDDLPQIVMPVAVEGKGIARSGHKVFAHEKPVGVVTSGTMVPYWVPRGQGVSAAPGETKASRPVGLALLDSRLQPGDKVEIEIRNRKVAATIAPYFLRSEAPPYARAILSFERQAKVPEGVKDSKHQYTSKAGALVGKALENTRWRSTQCINLIPSEQSPSPIVRMLSIMDPVCRYAEHKRIKALEEADVFYYQGTDFISEVETLLVEELKQFLGCREVETRLISGQMANAAVFSALVDYINRTDRKREQRRIGRVMNNHIIKGGHLSAQPMGALRDFVARDPQTERPAVVNFPVCEDNPYRMDARACKALIEQYRPELIILGKSMVLHPEPVKEIRECVDELALSTVIMYDMAHVLGLVGPHFQEPFKEGAHIVTGSTHKTYFGTQRGIVAADYDPTESVYELWEAIERRSFPGSTSNHHLGTQLGLLMAAYEMNAFKEPYQQNVLANAKALAKALSDCGLEVAGDPAAGFTETHQVVVNVGYAKGPGIARRLEENGIIVNYQAAPREEGFTASGALRLGVSEMTRFGMAADDFGQVAQLMHDVIVKGKTVQEEVMRLRERFLTMQYCFTDQQLDASLEKIFSLLK